MRNTAFISYSHAADGKLAPALQRALHNFAKPWYQLRALRVFRDKTSLAANPALWPAIEAALDDSLWFVYMASPQAAKSEWVQKEIDWWLTHRSSGKMLIVLTDGKLQWDDETQDFDWSETTAVPQNARGAFSDEPLYVDLRWARTEDNLSLRHSQFRGVILDLAAALHDKAKEDLDGDDVRQHRRNKAWAWSAGVSLAFLFLLAIVFGVFAVQQRNQALRQRDEAVGRLYAQQVARAVDLADNDPGLALDVLDETNRSAGDLREFTSDLYARLSDRTVFALGGAWNNHGTTNKDAAPVLALSGDGSRLATALQRPTDRRSRTSLEVLLWNTKTGALLATLPMAEGRDVGEERVGTIVFSPDDRELAASTGSSVKVWDTGTGSELMAAQAFGDVKFLIFMGGGAVDSSGDSRRLVAFHDDDATEWRGIGPRAARRKVASNYVGAVAPARDERNVFIASHRSIERWNPETGARSSVLNPAGVQFLVAMSPDGERIAQANGYDIRVWRSGRDSVEWDLKRGHRESIESLAFAPDGRTLASGGDDGTVRLWDLDRGTATLRMRGPRGAVTWLEFSRDGKRLAAGGADASAFVWDVAGPLVRPADRLQIPGKHTCAAVSSRAATLLFGSGTTMTVRHALNDRQPQNFSIGGAIKSCGMSSDGAVAYAVDEGLNVVVANAQTGHILTRTEPITDHASVRLSADGNSVAAYLGPGRFGVWDNATGKRAAQIDVDGKLEGPFEMLNRGVVVAQFSNSRGSWVGTWDSRTSRKVSVTTTPKWGGYRQQFGLCPARLLFASTDGDDLQIADLASGTLKRRFEWNLSKRVSNANYVTRIVFSPDCSMVAVGDGVGQIALWNIASGETRYNVAAHSGMQMQGSTTLYDADGVTALEFSPDGRTIASGGATAAGLGELKLWDALRGSLLATLPADNGSVQQVMFSANGSYLGVLASGDAGTVLEVWNAQGPERALLSADAGPITRLEFSPDGTHLISEGPTLTKSWDLARNQTDRVWNRSKPVSSAATRTVPGIQSPDGKFSVQVVSSEWLLVTQGAQERRLYYDEAKEYFPTQPIQAMHLMADGTLVSLAGYGSDRPAEITRWDLAAGRPMRKAFEGSTVDASLVFSPDERTFVTTGSIGDRRGLPGVVHVWDAQDLTLLAALPGHRAQVTAAAFSKDGKQLATGDANGFVRVWDLPPPNAPPRR